jgi:hypothetical protein
MAEMGRYCKAYLVKDLSQFAGWSPDLSNLHSETRYEDGREVTEVRTELKDDDILYLQEDLRVTDGIFLDENVVFSDVTPEWTAFCTETLEFRVPVEELEYEYDADKYAANGASAEPAESAAAEG